ncbi:MAG TPA: lipopolysaccharide kinase InaA family protein [Mycobacterium sp.]|nr:lipopolysaccharide kinase InaA family protein [Mycobacterium sp.]
MKIPTNGDYVQALQNPSQCFHDPELKAGQVELTKLGMPKAISGNFASVFSITGASGKRYAVKCFTSNVSGQDQRYKAIHDLLADLRRPWQVGFDYIRQGVLVDGDWHSILRMEWVENSQTLIPWLAENLASPDRILNVAEQFSQCVVDMHSAGIAHGDLQHGNILIDSGGKLRLIDYDGMFVPSIQNLGSNEIGLANYQHPSRTGKDFTPDLDRFSAWLIYGSLLSLADHPGVWWTFRNDGDEKLLFGKEDFNPPFDSIRRLGALGSPHKEFADVLTESLTSLNSLAGVPKFDSSRIPRPTQTAASSTSTSGWWKQANATGSGAASTSDAPTTGAKLGASWLRSHEAPLPPVDMGGPSRTAKAMAFLMAAVAIISTVAVVNSLGLLLGGLTLLSWAFVMTGSTWVIWRRSGVVADRRTARRKLKSAAQEVTAQKKLLAEAQSARAALDGDERRALQALEDQRSKLGPSSTSEFERKSKGLGKQLKKLQEELNLLDASKAKEAQQQLKRLQESHTQTNLASRRIEAGVIPGIGPSLAASLWVHGLRTAADIAEVRGTQFRKTGTSHWFTIHGIGPSKSFDISWWHSRAVAAASSSAPQTLPAHEVRALDTKYANLKRQHQNAIDALGPQTQRIKAEVDAKYKALDNEILVKQEAVRLDYRRQRAAADMRVAEAATNLQKREEDLLDAERDLARYAQVSLSKYLKA